MYTIFLFVFALLTASLIYSAPHDLHGVSPQDHPVAVVGPTPASLNDIPSVVARAPIKEFTSYVPVNPVGYNPEVWKALSEILACKAM